MLTLVAPDPCSEQYKLIGRPTGVVLVTEEVPAKYIDMEKTRSAFWPHAAAEARDVSAAAIDGSANAQSLLLRKQKPIWGGVFTRFEDEDGNSFALVSLDEMNQAVEEQRRAAPEKMESERRATHEMEIASRYRPALFRKAFHRWVLS